MKDFRNTLGVLLTFALIWALMFGVTVDGKHYRIRCNEADGLKVEK